MRAALQLLRGAASAAQLLRGGVGLGGLPCTGCTAEGRTAVRRAVTARPNKCMSRAAQRCERGARRGGRTRAHA